MLTCLVLSYGGIGTFIIAFSLYPIAVALFQKADIPKKLIVATIMVTPVTVCMAMLPGSPSTQNLIPTNYFGTNAFAGPVLGILSSVLMFIGFSKLTVSPSKVINLAASTAFGIYLVHDNELLRPFIWKKLFRVASYKDSALLVPFSLAVILAVFFGSMLIELVRKYTLEKLADRPLRALAGKLDRGLEKLRSSSLFDKL